MAKNIVCGLEHLPIFQQSHQEAHTPEHQDHHGKKNHHQDSNQEKDHQHDHKTPEPTITDKGHKEHSHDHNKSEKENCCKDLTTIFHSSLVKPQQVKTEHKVLLGEPTFSDHFSFKSRVICYKAADYFSWRTPPPKIPDIRVFIQSFLI